jgi:hypothetical protein
MATKIKAVTLVSKDEPSKKRSRKPKVSEVKEIVVPDAATARKEMLDFFQLMNISELVDLCCLKGVRVTCISSKEELIAILMDEKTAPATLGHLGEIRDMINGILASSPLVRTLPGCPRDCWKHPDYLVIECFKNLDKSLRMMKVVSERIDRTRAVNDMLLGGK